jgi:hypothetical protein
MLEGVTTGQFNKWRWAIVRELSEREGKRQRSSHIHPPIPCSIITLLNSGVYPALAGMREVQTVDSIQGYRTMLSWKPLCSHTAFWETPKSIYSMTEAQFVAFNEERGKVALARALESNKHSWERPRPRIWAAPYMETRTRSPMTLHSSHSSN